MKSHKLKSKHIKREEQELESSSDRNDADLAREFGAGDPNFKSELDYDGYHTIEESDNNAYGSLDPERTEDTPFEVRIKDREEEPGMGEESVIDPQENRA